MLVIHTVLLEGGITQIRKDQNSKEIKWNQMTQQKKENISETYVQFPTETEWKITFNFQVISLIDLTVKHL